jgi:hypothetical protein
MRSTIRNSLAGVLTAAALGLAAAGATVPAEAAIYYGHHYAGRGGLDRSFAYRGAYRHGYGWRGGYYGYRGPGWAYGSYYCGPWPFSMVVNPWACL